ncbi:MAG: hypothetical protein AB3N34_00055 [Lettuce witches'-broom phytoplasma]
MNFFKKHETTIYAVIIFLIAIAVGIFLGINDTKKEQKSLSNYHKDFEDDKEANQSTRTKREIQPPQNQNPSPQTDTTSIPNSKIKITKEKYDKITSYILSENEHEILPFNNLSPQETTVIEEARDSHKQTLRFRKRRLEKINELQQECDNYNKQINKLDPGKDKNEIEGLNNMLSNAIKLRDSLQRNYDKSLLKDNQFALTSINSLYEIFHMRDKNKGDLING